MVPLADQVLSGVSNMLAIVLVARALSADNFGRFALGFTVLTVNLSVSRAYFGTRVSLARDHASARRTTASLAGAITLLAPLLAVLVLGVSAAATGGAGFGILLAVALATPVVLLQDILRFGSAAAGQPGVALASDAVWVALMAVPFVLGRDPSPTVALSLWAFGALVAMLVACVMMRIRPRLATGWAELKRRDRMGESLTLGALIGNLGGLWVLLLVTVAIGPQATGSLRGAASTMAPVNVLLAFCAISVTTTLARRERGGDRSFTFGIAVAMAAATLGWGVLLLLLPDPAGRAAFGQSWNGIRDVLPFTVVEYFWTCLAAGAITGLKVTNGFAELRHLRIAGGVVTVGLGSLAALATDSVSLVAATMSLSAVVTAAVAWWCWTRQLGRAKQVPETLSNPAGPVGTGRP